MRASESRLDQLLISKASHQGVTLRSSTTPHISFHMALNWAMLNPNRIPVPLPQEMTITTVDSGVDISLTIPDHAAVADEKPTGASSAGGSSGIKYLKSNGKLYLTDQRVCCTTQYPTLIIRHL